MEIFVSIKVWLLAKKGAVSLAVWGCSGKAKVQNRECCRFYAYVTPIPPM